MSLRILVVDDCEDFVEGLGALLRLEGHTVATAKNGCSAILLSDGFQPDVVLLDLRLPEVNGYETADQIRERMVPAPTPIAISGSPGEDARALAARFDAYLPKPLEVAQLIDLLRRLE